MEIGSLLGTVLEEEEFSVTQINSEKLLEELMLLMEKLRAYEIDEAEKIIQKLQHIKCANLLGKELIEDIKQDVTVLNLTGHLIKQRSYTNVWKEVNANESKTIDTSV